MTEIVRAQQVGEAMYRVVLRDPQAAREWRQDNRRLVTLTIPQLREQLVLTIWEADAFAGTITVYIPAAATRGP